MYRHSFNLANPGTFFVFSIAQFCEKLDGFLFLESPKPLAISKKRLGCIEDICREEYDREQRKGLDSYDDYTRYVATLYERI